MRARGAGKAPREELSRESRKPHKEPSREGLRSPWSSLAGAWRDLANMTTALVAIVAPQSLGKG